jgi:tetratricopeptide (TPR) repeat protein
MRKVLQLWSLLCAVAVVPLSGCQKIEARMELKKGNGLYKQEQYKDALESFKKGLEMDPDATFAWRSVGLTSMALFKPGNKTEENLAYADQAIEAFKKYLVDYPEAPKVLEYLVNLFIASDRLDDGIAYLQQFGAEHPDNQSVNISMVTMMTKAGKIADALQFANEHGGSKDDPQVYYLIGVNAWDKSYNDVHLTMEERPNVIDTGLAAMDRALQLRRDFQTLVYTNLLYREKAKLFLPDPNQPTPKPGKVDPELAAKAAELKAKHDELIDLANKFAKEASDLKKEEDRRKAEQEKAQGIGDGHLPPQPVIPGTEPTAEPTPIGSPVAGAAGLPPEAGGTPGAMPPAAAQTPAAGTGAQGGSSQPDTEKRPTPSKGSEGKKPGSPQKPPQ